MGRKEKLLKKIRSNLKQVRFEKIDKLLRHSGFEERHTGSHYVYSHPRISGIITIVRPHGRAGSQFVSPIYIKKALTILQKLEELDS